MSKNTCKCETFRSKPIVTSRRPFLFEKDVTVARRDQEILEEIPGVEAAWPCGASEKEITCDDKGYVAEIRLSRKNLTMKRIPSGLLKLNYTRLLAINNNAIAGPIPSTICRDLPHLTHALLYRNKLNGPIPDDIGQCGRLVSFVAYGNRLDGTLPDSIWRLRRLRVLDLSFNRLEGTVSNELDRLVDLEALYLDHNRFSGPFPSAIGRLWSIQTMRLNDNDAMSGVARKVAVEDIFSDALLDRAVGTRGLRDAQGGFARTRRREHEYSG